MKSYLICAIIVLVIFQNSALVLCEPQPESQNRPIGGDNESTMRILQRLCQPGNHNDDVAARFFGCWYQSKGVDVAIDCQNKIFGGLQNTKCNIDKACMAPPGSSRAPMYLGCLQTGLKAIGLDFMTEATIVNVCMGQVLGF